MANRWKVTAIFLTCLTMIGCGRDLFEVQKVSVGMKNVNTGEFDDSPRTPALKVTSAFFSIDRKEVFDIIEKHGYKIISGDWCRIIVDSEDREGFIRTVRKDLNRFGSHWNG